MNTGMRYTFGRSKEKDFFGESKLLLSLRKILFKNVDPVLTIRRTSDNLEAEVLFDSNGTISNQSPLIGYSENLGQFIGNSDGRVKKWNDQSDIRIKFSQLDFLKQPYLYENGILNLKNNKPAISFKGSSSLEASVKYNYPSHTIICITNKNINHAGSVIDASDGGSRGLRMIYVNSTMDYQVGDNSGSTRLFISSSNAQQLFFATSDNSQKKLYKNLTTFVTQNINGFIYSYNRATVIGDSSEGVSYPLNGTIQEIIIYNEDKSLLRNEIMTSINNYYSTF